MILKTKTLFSLKQLRIVITKNILTSISKITVLVKPALASNDMASHTWKWVINIEFLLHKTPIRELALG